MENKLRSLVITRWNKQNPYRLSGTVKGIAVDYLMEQ